jgi:cytochrome c oxidase subunit II
MPGKGDLRSDVEMMGFVMPCHAGATRRSGAGCVGRAPTVPTKIGALLLPLALGGCTGELSTLDPAGPAAARVAELWWVMFAGAMLILTGVVGTALWALRSPARPREFSEKRVLVGWGLVFPAVTLSALMAFAFLRGEQLLARPEPAALEVHGHARQWFWTFGYPDGRVTLGALHVRAGETFHVAITSEDVIHSFWVPRLGGKMDAIPGKERRIALRADAPGTYRGICAEFCGDGHAHMMFEVQAHAPEDFDAALAAAAAETPDDLPVLIPRRTPAQSIIGQWIDYLAGWLGVK